MATATLTSQLTSVSLDPGSPNALGTGNAPASETAIQLEGSNCAAMGHSGSVGPTAPTSISQFRGCEVAVTSFTRTDMHLHLWVRDLYPIRNVNIGGISIYINGTNAAIYYMTGLDKGYAGGWFHAVLNLDAGDRPAASLGTAPSSNIVNVGMVGNISATKGESFLQNCYFDAARRGTGGQGNTFTGGTTGDRLLFSDIAAADASSYGMFRNVGGAFFIEGPITFGVATSTTYLQDSLQTINFTNFTVNNGTGGTTIVAAVASDYYRIIFADGTTGITDFRVTNLTWKGVSKNIPFSYDTSALSTGDSHVCPDEIFVFASTVTFGAQTTKLRPSFVECVTIIPNGITLTDPSFSNCDTITLTAANDAISGGSTSLHNTITAVPFITTNSLAKISNHTFDNTAGVGHAIEITTAGTYSFAGNTFTGYGADASNDAAIYNNSGGLVTINISGGGSTPTIRNGAGASTTISSSPAIISVTVKDEITDSVIQGVAVTITCGSTGSLPFEDTVTITRVGTTATVAHTGHGLTTGKKIKLTGAVQNEYNRIKAITVINANSYSYTVSGTPASPATGTILATAILIDGLTDVNGNIQDSRVYTANQSYTGIIQKGTTPPIYKARPVSGTVDSTSGATLNTLLTQD